MSDDWKSSLPEDLKDASELKNFKGVEDLAKSYVTNSKLLSSKIDKMEKTDTFDAFSLKAEKFFHLPKENKDYKGDDNQDINALGHKYRLHPDFQLKPFLKDFMEYQKKVLDAEQAEKSEKWETSNKDLFKDLGSEKDEVLGRAFKRLDTTREKWEQDMGENAKNPGVQRLLLALGKVEVPTKSGEKSPITPGSGGEGSSIPLGIEEQLEYVQKHTRDPKSPYFDSRNPSHSEVRSKVRSYVKALSEYEKKHGVKLGQKTDKSY